MKLYELIPHLKEGDKFKFKNSSIIYECKMIGVVLEVWNIEVPCPTDFTLDMLKMEVELIKEPLLNEDGIKFLKDNVSCKVQGAYSIMIFRNVKIDNRTSLMKDVKCDVIEVFTSGKDYYLFLNEDEAKIFSNLEEEKAYSLEELGV